MKRDVPGPEVLTADVRLGVVDPRRHVRGVAVPRHCAGRYPGCSGGAVTAQRSRPGRGGSSRPEG